MVLSKEVTWSDLGPKRDDPGSHVESRPKLWAEAPALIKDSSSFRWQKIGLDLHENYGGE